MSVAEEAFPIATKAHCAEDKTGSHVPETWSVTEIQKVSLGHIFKHMCICNG